MGLQRVRHDWATFTFTLSSNIMSDFYFFLSTFQYFPKCTYEFSIFLLSSFLLFMWHVYLTKKCYSAGGGRGRGGGKRESKCTSLTGIICLVTKLCPPLLQPHGCSLPGSSVHGISQAKILEWVAMSFSRRSFWPRVRTHISCTGRQIFFTTEPLRWWCYLYIQPTEVLQGGRINFQLSRLMRGSSITDNTKTNMFILATFVFFILFIYSWILADN